MAQVGSELSSNTTHKDMVCLHTHVPAEQVAPDCPELRLQMETHFS